MVKLCEPLFAIQGTVLDVCLKCLYDADITWD